MTFDTVTIPQDDLYTLIYSSLGYALGRRTYITQVTAEHVRTYWPALRPWQRGHVLRLLRETVERYNRISTLIGDEVDDAAWRALLSWCEAQVAGLATEAP